MKNDAVNSPKHYTSHPSGIECITVTEHMGFNLGNAIKYVWRADLKHDAIEDLRKAAWYINREIEKRTKGESTFPKIELQGPLVAPETIHSRKAYGLRVAEAFQVAAMQRVATLHDADVISKLNLAAIVDKVEAAK